MTLVTPLRLDHLQQGFFEALTLGFASQATPPLITWARQQISFEQVPDGGGLVSLSVTAGPVPFIRQSLRGQTVMAATSIAVEVDSAVSGRRYWMRFNGFDYFHDADGADTVTTIRDALIGQVNDDIYATATASASGSSVVLTADFAGGIRRLEVAGPLTLGTPVLGAQAVQLIEGSSRLSVAIECFSKNREERNGAGAMTQIAMAALQSDGPQEILRRYDIGLGAKFQPVDLSAVVGGSWETRQIFNVDTYVPSAWVQAIDHIESATVTTALN